MKSGERVGIYEILAPLGAGGMGQVWRARDTRLERQVAVKSLPPAFALDPDRLARFEREARTLASLNHPNIAQVFGLERGDETVIVMELVDGEDLAQRIERGPVPLEEALPIARQIAEALAAAHDAGIVHRDLKPANVRVRADGTVKVLDFGLAKADGPAASAISGATQSPTLLSPAVTQAGVILGTAAYMSPEQAKGRAVDRRADVWAFGCVLLEMLSGRRAFDGNDVTEVLAAVIKDTPPLEALPADTPDSIRRLLRRCLQKDPAARLDSLRAARLEIDDATAGEPPAATASGTGPWRRLAIGLAAALTVAVAAAAWTMLRPPAAQEQPLRYLELDLHESAFRSISISPDGATLARSDDQGIQVRPLDEPAWRHLTDERGSRLAWAPDGKRFIYVAGHALRLGDLAGSPPRTICNDCVQAGRLRGMSWNGQDTLLLGYAGGRGGLTAVDVGSGELRPVTRIDARRAENTHRFPYFLPDGRRFLFAARADTGDHTVSLASLDSDVVSPLVAAFSEVAYAAGQVLFVRGGNLYAQQLDLDAATMVGDPLLLAENVDYFAGTGDAHFVVAGGGTLIYAHGSESGRPAWFDRQGMQVADVPLPWDSTLQGGLLAFGATRYVTAVLDPALGSTDVYAFDETTGAQTRVTSDPRWDQSPAWSHDGLAVLYRSQRAERPGVYLQPLDGSAERFLTEGISGDTGFLVPAPNGRDLLLAGVGSGIDRLDLAEPERRARWSEDGTEPAISADSRLVAYVSETSGMPQVYVRPLDGEGIERVATPCAARRPRWSASGHELYLLCDGYLHAVTVAAGPPPRAGMPQPLFRLPGNWISGSFDVDARGRFLGWQDGDRAGTAIVVLNWPRLLQSPR